MQFKFFMPLSIGARAVIVLSSESFINVHHPFDSLFDLIVSRFKNYFPVNYIKFKKNRLNFHVDSGYGMIVTQISFFSCRF